MKEKKSFVSLVQEKQINKKGEAMRNSNEREDLDNFELEDNYDFSGAVRGRFNKPKKVPTSMRLDNDILIF